MLVVRMFGQIQEEFGVNLPLTTLFRDATIHYLAEQIRAHVGISTWSSLVEIQPHGGKKPVFCVHGITGDVYWFGDLTRYMSPDQPVWGLQAKGLDGVQEPLSDIESIAAHYVREIRRFQPDGPYLIMGYSFGGSVAFEMARQLEAQGQIVDLLAILDHAMDNSGYYQVKLGLRFILGALSNLPYRLSDFLRLRPDQIVARLRRKFRVFEKKLVLLVNPGNDRSRSVQASDLIDDARKLPEHIQKLIEINEQAATRYIPGSYSGRVTLLRSRGGRLLCTHDPEMGWGRFAQQVEVVTIPGSHLRIFQEPHIRKLAGALQSCLDRAQEN
jgi:thioesterase domain-containing protein